ncbi:MAG: putative lipid II flippase FtsW [Clostridia bacterium]
MEATRTRKGKKPKSKFLSYFMLRPKRTERVDFLLFILVIVLLCFGLIMLFSASQNTSREDIYSIISKQLICAALGLGAMFVTSRIDYHGYRRLATPLFWGTIILMYLVPALGIVSHGARRQISVGGLSFQPSEICKFTLVIYFAALLSGKKHGDLTDKKNVLRYAFYLVIVAGACVLQSHLSALLLIVGVGFIMLFAAGLPWKYVFGLGGIIAAGGGLLAVLEPYRMKRLLSFLDPFADKQGDGWQIVQSLYAVGSGGLLGLGFGQSRQKYGYLPEAQNDYIYAIVCEELGFVGGMLVLVLFALLIFRGIQITFSSKDLFGVYLGFGIVVIIALQVIVNVGVVLSVLPSTGMQLPFFSSGGTSLIFMMAGLGILMNISRFSTQNKI